MRDKEYFKSLGWSNEACEAYIDVAERFEELDKDNVDNHTHHIIPRCCGGEDNLNNTVKISPYHHKILHNMLLKVYVASGDNGPISNTSYMKLQYAYERMKHERVYKNPGTRAKDKRLKEYEVKLVRKGLLIALHSGELKETEVNKLQDIMNKFC